MNTISRLAAVAGAIAVIAAAFYIWRTQHQIERLGDRLVEAEADAEAALSAVITPDILQTAERSVYLVRINGDLMGSAFVVDRERGALATAAHVIEEMPFDEEGATIDVVNRNGVVMPIIAGRMHTGYGRFTEVLKKYGPFRKDSDAFAPRAVGFINASHDAGLLLVDPIDPETGENLLGPDLPLASEDTLLALKGGDPIAVVGYPANMVSETTSGDSAAARVRRGILSTTVSAIDQADAGQDPRAKMLLIHRIGTSPGDSGGAILNARGEVIGVHSHGLKSMNAPADSLSQRADVIYDLLDPLREEKAVETFFVPDWRRRLEKYAPTEEFLPKAAFRRYAPQETDEDLEKPAIELDLDDYEGVASGIFGATLQKASEEVLVSAPDLADAPPDAEKKQDADADERIVASAAPHFAFKNVDSYVLFDWWLAANHNVAAIAANYVPTIHARSARNYDGSALCDIDLYTRRRGEVAFKREGSGKSPGVVFENASSQTAYYQILILRRDGCYGADEAVNFAFVSWRRDEEGETAPAQTASAAAHSTEKPVALHVSLGDALKRLVSKSTCAIGLRSDDQRCAQTVDVSYTPVPAHQLVHATQTFATRSLAPSTSPAPPSSLPE